MSEKQAVVVAGYYGFGNLGDEAIRDALVGELTRSELVTPIFLVAAPRRANEVKRSSPIRVFAALRGASALLFGGGGLLQNRTSNRSLYYYLSLILLARLSRRPVFLLGQGIGPIRGMLARGATHYALSKAVYIGCRDQRSLDLLERIGLKGVLDGDLFFLFPPIAQLLAAPRDETPRIILSLKDPGTATRQELIEQSVELIEGVHGDTSALFILLPFFPAKDLSLAEEITRRLSFPCQITCPDSVEEASEAIASADLLISSRLHPLEFALRVGTPMLAIAEDPKVKQLVKEVRSVDGPQIPCTTFPSLEEVLLLLNYPPQRDFLQAAYRQLHERTDEAFSSFLSKLETVLGGRDG